MKPTRNRKRNIKYDYLVQVNLLTIIVYTEVKLRKTDRIMPLLIKTLLYKLSSNFVDFFFVDLVSFYYSESG